LPKPGDRVEEYELVSLLGRGGNGEVWRAGDGSSEVAIKFLKTSGAPADAAARFAREVRALERLRELEGVLPVLRSGPAVIGKFPPWFAMPIAEPLQSRLGKDADLGDICRCVSSLAGVLSGVHALGMAHRDVKPANAYWYAGRWCWGDFGLVALLDAESLTANGKKLGPMHYIAPEMLNTPDSADGSLADVYSLGKMLWVLVSGQQYPIPGVHEPTTRGVGLREWRKDERVGSLDELIRKMTLLDPARRIRVGDVAIELASIASLDQTSTTSGDVGPVLRALRDAVGHHHALQVESERQSELLDETANRLTGAVTRIARQIEESTQLTAEGYYEIPQYWAPRMAIGRPRAIEERSHGIQFIAGGHIWKCRFGVGYRADLLADGHVHVCLGFWMHRVLNGAVAREYSGSVPWHKRGTAPNGLPMSHKLVSELVEEMKAQFPRALTEYTGEVQRVSDS